MLFSRLLAVATTVAIAPPIQAQTVTIDLDVFGLNENQIELNQMLDNACSGLDATNIGAAAQDLLLTCNRLLPLDDDNSQLPPGLDRLIPEEAFAISDTLTDAADLQVTNVQARINSLRRQDLNKQTDNDSIRDAGGGASYSPLKRKWEPFFNSQLSSGNVDGARLQQNANVATNQLTVGFDYRVSDDLIAGAGIGLFQNETDFATSAGRNRVAGLNMTLFSTFSLPHRSYADVVLDIGSSRYDQSRQINLDGEAEVLALSDTESASVSLTAGLGRTFRITQWDFSPYARLAYTNASVDGYRERANSTSPGFGSTLEVKGQSISSLTYSVGATAARIINTTRAVLVPQLSLEAEFEAEADKTQLSASFLADPDQTSFNVIGEQRDTAYLNLGVGGIAIFTGGRSAYLYYETRLAHELVDQHWLKAGVRLEF